MAALPTALLITAVILCVLAALPLPHGYTFNLLAAGVTCLAAARLAGG